VHCLSIQTKHLSLNKHGQEEVTGMPVEGSNLFVDKSCLVEGVDHLTYQYQVIQAILFCINFILMAF
jgi:hypothetical protein